MTQDINARVALVLKDGTEVDSTNKLPVSATFAAVGAGTAAAAGRVTLASDDPLVAKIPASLGAKAASASLSVTQAAYEYETVAASQTAQVLGATGATGDYLSHIIIQPTTTAAGTVTVLDNATVIFTFTTGTLADLSPKTIPFNLVSVSGAWKITTGANVAVIGIGDFT